MSLCVPVPLLNPSVAIAILKSVRETLTQETPRRRSEQSVQDQPAWAVDAQSWWDSLSEIVPLDQVATWIRIYFNKEWAADFFRDTPLHAHLNEGS